MTISIAWRDTMQPLSSTNEQPPCRRRMFEQCGFSQGNAGPPVGLIGWKGTLRNSVAQPFAEGSVLRRHPPMTIRVVLAPSLFAALP